MQGTQIDAVRRALANLATRPETSFALRDYLRASRDRDIVDLLHEIDCLAEVTTLGPEDPKGSLSSRSS